MAATAATDSPSARNRSARYRFQRRTRGSLTAAASKAARCVSVKVIAICGASSRDSVAYSLQQLTTIHLVAWIFIVGVGLNRW